MTPQRRIPAWLYRSVAAVALLLAPATLFAEGGAHAKFWYLKKPSPETQTRKTPAERGVNPCDTPDPGFGRYEKWVRVAGNAQMLVPKAGALSANGEFDVMFHFHGHEPARKEWVQAMTRPVFVATTLGTGSGPYETTFKEPGAFERMVKSVEQALSTEVRTAKVRRLGLSAWSAGYGAVQEILRQPYGRDRVDTVVLLDGLHAGYFGDGLNEAQLEPFVRFAKKAAADQALMVVSHSSIIPPGYASTTETSNFLIDEVGGRPVRAKPRPSDPMGLDLLDRFDKGGFHVRGYAGGSELDHCAHLGLYRDILKVHVLPRWSPSRAKKR
ncbi:MAG TPA: hypothetical protein VF103_08975 [Polyangiaceae bacterium]